MTPVSDAPAQATQDHSAPALRRATLHVLKRTPEWLIVLAMFFVVALFVHAQKQDLRYNLLGGGDGYTAGLPSKIFSAKLSPWNPYVQLGQYTFANTQFQPFYPPGLITMALFPNTLGYNLFILLHYAAAGLFFHLFARNLKLSAYASFMGGLAFLCSGFLLSHKGHQAMMSTAVWLPLILLFCDRYARRFEFRYAVYAGVVLAMSILGGFPQVTVYSLLIVVPYTVFRCFERVQAPKLTRLRAAVIGVAAMGIFAALLSSVQLVAVAETLPHVTRQRISLDMFSEDSLPAYHLLAFFVPNALGGFHGIPTYSWNMNVVELYPYSGLIPIALAVFCFLYLRRRRSDVWFWVAIAGIATVLSLGFEPVQKALYKIPVYNLFRAPARHLYEINFALCVLTALACDRLFNDGVAKTRRMRAAVRTTAIVFATLFLMVLGVLRLVRWGAESVGTASAAGLEQVRVSPIFTLGTVKPFLLRNLQWDHPTMFYPVIAAILTILLLLVFWRVPKRLAMAMLPLILVGDVWSVYRTIYDNPDTRPLYEGRRLRPEIPLLLGQRKFDREHYRILPLDPAVGHTYPLLNMMYGLSAINDYTPMWLRRYQTVTGFPLNGAAPMDLIAQHKLLSALSVQYLMTREPAIETVVRNTTAGSATSVTRLPIPPINCAALNCGSTTFPQPGTLRLQAPGGPPVAIVHIPIVLEPKKIYQFEFEARTVAVDPEPKPLMFDLYWVEPNRPPYDSPEQDGSVRFLRRDFMKYTVAINAGATPPKNAFARIFTQSTTPVEIRNLSLGIAQTSASSAYNEAGRTNDGLRIFENPTATPRFRFASQLKPAADLTEAQAMMTESTFDPARHAIVEGLDRPLTMQPGTIVSERIDNNFMSWTVRTGEKAFFVVGDSWFPGWTATVDGRDTKIHIVNGLMRGVFVEGSGTHRIQMTFWPRSLTLGLAGTLFALVVLGGTLVHSRRYRTAVNDDVAETSSVRPQAADPQLASRPSAKAVAVGTARVSPRAVAALCGVMAAAAIASVSYYHSLDIPLLHDAQGYYRIAVDILNKGLFSRFELSDLRTYGYPTLLGALLQVADGTGLSERFTVFVFQFGLHVLAAVLLRFTLLRNDVPSWTAEAVFFSVLLNPFVLIYTPYMLTESVSLSLGVSVIACVVALLGKSLRPLYCIVAGSFLCGFMIEVRPANIFIVPAWLAAVGVALFRSSSMPRVRAYGMIATALLFLSLPALPQITNNAIYYGKATPLIASNLGKELQYYGIRFSKYATKASSGADVGITYVNPFVHDEVLAASNPMQWYVRYPGYGAGTVALHIFNLFDQDLPMPYTIDLDPPYYPVVSPLNFAVIALGFAGAVAAWRRRRQLSRVEVGVFFIVGVAVAAHIAVHATVCVEARFGLALLIPLYASAVVYTIQLIRSGSRRERAAVATAVLLIALPASALSRWVRTQSPEIQSAIAAEDPERKKAAARLLASSGPGTIAFGELNEWTLINARVAPDGSAVLVSDGGQPSTIQHRVALEKDTDYRVEFEVSSPFAGGTLSVDLYGGPEYDSPAQNSILTAFDPVYSRVTYTWNSGANAPASAFLRFVSISPHPVQIRNVKFVKVN